MSGVGRRLAGIVFAAGRGQRMKSERPKVLLELAKRPMIQYTIDTLFGLPLGEIVVVVGYQAEAVRVAVEEVAGERLRFVLQEPLRGTGDALRLGVEALSTDATDLLVVNGDDSAFYTVPTLAGFLEFHAVERNTITMLFASRDAEMVFGRVYRNERGEFKFIDHETMVQRGLRLENVSTGAYVFDVGWLRANVTKIPRYPNGEFPIYELVYVAQRQRRPVGSTVLENDYEWISINTPEEWRIANDLMERVRAG